MQKMRILYTYCINVVTMKNLVVTPSLWFLIKDVRSIVLSSEDGKPMQRGHRPGIRKTNSDAIFQRI